MQLYDGLSINNNEELAVEVGDHAKNVKLVKLKTVHIKVSKREQLKRILPSWLTGKDNEVSIPASKVQVKLVDLGGHTAMVLVTVSFDLFGIPVKILCVLFGTPKKKGLCSKHLLELDLVDLNFAVEPSRGPQMGLRPLK